MIKTTHPLKSKDREQHARCPKCRSEKIRGPFDGAVDKLRRTFTRAWCCLDCWWKSEKVLYDDDVVV